MDTAAVATVAVIGVLVGLWLTDPHRDDPERADRARWYQPMGWALLVLASLLVVLGVPATAGTALAPQGSSAPVSTSGPAPAPPFEVAPGS